MQDANARSGSGRMASIKQESEVLLHEASGFEAEHRMTFEYPIAHGSLHPARQDFQGFYVPLHERQIANDGRVQPSTQLHRGQQVDPEEARLMLSRQVPMGVMRQSWDFIDGSELIGSNEEYQTSTGPAAYPGDFEPNAIFPPE